MGSLLEKLSVARIRLVRMRYTVVRLHQKRKGESIGRWYRSIPWYQSAGQAAFGEGGRKVGARGIASSIVCIRVSHVGLCVPRGAGTDMLPKHASKLFETSNYARQLRSRPGMAVFSDLLEQRLHFADDVGMLRSNVIPFPDVQLQVVKLRHRISARFSAS